MSLVIVKPKFQVTNPAKLRRDIISHEGDLLEATITCDGILLRPMYAVDRNAVANRIASNFAATEPSSKDAGCAENEIMQETIADIARVRRQRRHRKT